MRTSFIARTTVGVALLAVVAAGCSSGKKSTDNGSTGSAGSGSGGSASGAPVTPATGSPVKLMIVAVKNTPVLAQQEQFDAAQARVDYLNDHGGVNGHKLVLETCDSKLDPNAEQACLNKAVSEKVSAVVGSTLLFSTFKNLETAKIPLIGVQGITPAQLQSPIAYPVSSIFGWFAGIVQMAKSDGVKNISVGYIQADSAKFSDSLVLAQAKTAGLTVKTNLASALTTTDYTADAATLTKDNPDAVVVVGSTGTAPPLIKSMKAGGYTGKIYSFSADYTEENLSTFKDALEGVRISNVAMPLDNTSDPGVQAYKADMAQYAPKAKQDENGELGWGGVEMYYQIMKKATAFTGADVIAAADALKTPITVGPYGQINTTGTSPLSEYPRLFNHNFVPSTIKDGKIIADGGFVDALGS
jgi:ABC-type branched-subunit amino acid transport system substrate-binding protein